MNTELAVALIVGGFFAVAAVWIAVTRDRPSGEPAEPPEPPGPIVAWLRPKGYRMAHAFRVAELSDELANVDAWAFCGDRWPVAELVRLAEPIELGDDEVPRCAACRRAVDRMEHRDQ